MQANVGPTWAPLRGVSASPAVNRSMSRGAPYKLESFCHKLAGISEGGESHEHASGSPHTFLHSTGMG